MSDEFEIIVEWVIRKLRDINSFKADPNKIIRWVLYSLGVKDLGVDIYMYIRANRRATSTEIADKFRISPTTARRYLEQLHSLGLVDYIGREYHLTRMNIASCIRDILIPRIKSVLEDIASVADRVSSSSSKERILSVKDIHRLVLVPFRKEIDRTLKTAKEEAIKEIRRAFSSAKYVGPDIVSKIVSHIFDAISESLKRLGEKNIQKNIEIIKVEPTQEQKNQVRGLSIVETRDKIIYSVYSKYSLERIHLQYAKETGKKVVIRIYDTLLLSDDITQDLLESIDYIYVSGELIGPKHLIDLLRDRIQGPGKIKYY